MDRIDRLIMKASPKLTPWEKLQKDNPFLELSYEELKRIKPGHPLHDLAVGEDRVKYNYAYLLAWQKNRRERSAGNGRDQIKNQNPYGDPANPHPGNEYGS